ncbi:MAG TPA: haloacid dehalogenase-like hydrolase [Acidimicrobiales bacterium]|nr:haloacid dehalogenase-like hydrolase [Acidimicrobiales bacterium]
MIRRLLLWDVDGTLVRAGDLGAAVFDLALEQVLGVRPEQRVRMSGKTDPQIVTEYLYQMGVEETPDRMEAVLRGIEAELAAAEAAGELAATGRALPGVAAVLEALAADDRVLSTLVTGNVAPNALVKVAAFGLDQWLDLEVGAYGSDHADRNLLVPIATERLRAARGVVLGPSDVWVIGDTPRDLDCARAAGTRCLLVGTGRYSAAELEPLGADAVLEDLLDVPAVIKLLTGDL